MSDLAARVTPALMTSAQVATYLSVSQATLSRWRTFKSGPPFVNLAGLPRYLQADLDAWIATKKVTP